MAPLPVPPPDGGAPEWLFAAMAGIGGGLVRAWTRPDLSWLRLGGTALVGGVTSVYGTPVVAPIVKGYLAAYDVSYSGVAGFCGFLLGMAGLTLCEALIRRLRRTIDGKDEAK